MYGIVGEDEFVATVDLPDEFVRSARACLAFARDRPNVLGLLSRKDIEVVVGGGAPFLFKDGDDSVRKMRSFLGRDELYVTDTDKALTVDLMKYILSYVNNPSGSSERRNFENRELVESSIRRLLAEFAKLSCGSSHSSSFGSVPNHSPDRYGQPERPVGQKVEMKRGDWICPRCSFMNFARNMKCLECEETRPQRQLNGGEWECPQCDFFNYGRNMMCLRCDCKRPGEALLGAANTMSGIGNGNGKNANKVDIDSRLAANEEKAQRWFSKVSQLDSASDMSSAIADKDFPEILPLRKGVNRFVVSTRKTPLERRLASAQYQRNLGSDGTPEGNVSAGQNPGPASPHNISGSASPDYGSPRRSNSNYVPFVPLSPDMFVKKHGTSVMEGSEKMLTDKQESVDLNTIERGGNASGSNEPYKSGGIFQSNNPVSQTESKNKEKEQTEKSERWFKKVGELHNVTDLTNAISDEDFPEIMPMRKGENRFVVSKKKDRSLTSPAYKRRMAMEQAGNTNFVPFVPFPPDYFAKKDKPQPDGVDRTIEATSMSATAEKRLAMSYDARPRVLDEDDVQQRGNEKVSSDSWNVEDIEATSTSATAEKLLAMSYDARLGVLDEDDLQQRENEKVSSDNWNVEPSGANSTESKTGGDYREPIAGNLTLTSMDSQPTKDSVSGWNLGKENTSETPNLTSSPQPSENQNIRERWTGKSLEGSAVKEPDPLDMSEEAKAERWFRRVAQIKDISELSEIPDEDFPSIMPMRKGVNRFVVSKRKTPLERRLTSPQYRRNLPIVSSDPMKKENEGS